MSEARRLFMTADLDPHDTTLQVHAEALREIQKDNDNSSAPEEEDINFRQINEKIYYLLIKNVSRDSPLTPEEVQVCVFPRFSFPPCLVYRSFFGTVSTVVSIVHVW